MCGDQLRQHNVALWLTDDSFVSVPSSIMSMVLAIFLMLRRRIVPLIAGLHRLDQSRGGRSSLEHQRARARPSLRSISND